MDNFVKLKEQRFQKFNFKYTKYKNSNMICQIEFQVKNGKQQFFVMSQAQSHQIRAKSHSNAASCYKKKYAPNGAYRPNNP